ncbi:dynactin subunit 2 isoform X2 [Cimex lectularius]|uniref:Dynactin subunit 2 n=1 Tax=Cimex lectularius TaxID=79782 RepID=A0A8I6TGG8_CIMLE|nr:dynactin subunit 2 isoform X2 [Cimex lectularius]
MADPKYAHLSGIAYDQPDVYETTDLPEADQTKEEPEEESESIEHVKINASDAFSKFKGKHLNAKKVDFSDRLSKTFKTGYGISGEWQLVPPGEIETPLQKYQRLKCEMKELLEEVAQVKESEKETNENIDGAVITNLEVMSKQLEELALDKTFGTELVTNLADPEGAQIKKMLSELDQLGSVDSSKGKGDSRVVPGEGPSCEVKYKVSTRPHQVHLGSSARIADLEARVKKLNAIVANTPDTLRRLVGGGEKSLTETSHWVAGKVALLDTSQLEAIDVRMSALLTKLDQLAERSSAITGSSDIEADNKIAELYELTKTTEEMAQVLPRALDRMVALEALHQQGNGFIKSLSEVESMQQTLVNSCETTKEALKKMEEHFTVSVKNLKQSLEDMDKRIKTLSEAKKKK